MTYHFVKLIYRSVNHRKSLHWLLTTSGDIKRHLILILLIHTSTIQNMSDQMTVILSRSGVSSTMSHSKRSFLRNSCKTCLRSILSHFEPARRSLRTKTTTTRGLPWITCTAYRFENNFHVVVVVVFAVRSHRACTSSPLPPLHSHNFTIIALSCRRLRESCAHGIPGFAFQQLRIIVSHKSRTQGHQLDGLAWKIAVQRQPWTRKTRLWLCNPVVCFCTFWLWFGRFCGPNGKPHVAHWHHSCWPACDLCAPKNRIINQHLPAIMCYLMVMMIPSFLVSSRYSLRKLLRFRSSSYIWPASEAFLSFRCVRIHRKCTFFIHFLIKYRKTMRKTVRLFFSSEIRLDSTARYGKIRECENTLLFHWHYLGCAIYSIF